MNRKILVSVRPYETRGAIIDGEKPIELFFENPDDEKLVGCIIKGRVSNILAGTQSAFVDIGIHKDAYLAFSGVEGGEADDEEDLKDIFKSPIQDVLKVGQEVILQVLKEPTPAKGPRSTMTISLPGRYLVYTPTTEQIGVSRKISHDAERDRLRAIGKRICPKGRGLIFRTAAEGQEEKDLQDDLRFLQKLWNKVENRAKSLPPRSILHRDISLTLKLVREYFTDEVDRFLIDSPEEYKGILEDCDFLSPFQRAALELYQEPTPLFEKYGIEHEIERALSSKVWLETGSYIIIERTEALVTIDVNSGRFSGGVDLEETVFKVNLEAAKEIARQVRLRNLAGIIIIDFIDMNDPKNRAKVLKTLREAFKGDRNRPNISDFTDHGLVQMTRRRNALSLDEIIKEKCPCCGGIGRILSISTLKNRIRRAILIEAERFQTDRIQVRAHKIVIDQLRKKNDAAVKEIEKRVGRQIIFQVENGLDIEAFKVEALIEK